MTTPEEDRWKFEDEDWDLKPPPKPPTRAEILRYKAKCLPYNALRRAYLLLTPWKHAERKQQDEACADLGLWMHHNILLPALGQPCTGCEREEWHVDAR